MLILVINTNLPPILHRFRDMAFDIVQNRYILLPLLCLTASTEGFLCGDLSKFSVNVNGWPRYQIP